MIDTKELGLVPETAEIIVGKNPTQQVVLVEIITPQGIPGPPGGQIPEPVAGDEQKVAIVRNLGSGPVWRADFVKVADIDPASATLDFRPRELLATNVVFGAESRARLQTIAGTSAQVTLDTTGGGTGWRLTWATGLLQWLVAGVAKFSIAADGTVGFLKGLFSGMVTVNLDPTPPPAPLAAGTVLQGVAAPGTGAEIELVGFGATPRFGARHANGTAAAPVATNAGAVIAAFGGFGRGATQWGATVAAQMHFAATENWTDTAHGAAIRFQTTLNGTAAPAVRWEMSQAGHFIPIAANAYDLGSAALPVRSFYGAGPIVLNNTGGAVPAPMGADTLISANATGDARSELNAFGGVPLFIGRAARGTGAAPTATKANDYLAALQGRGYGATGYAVAGRASINFQATQDWTDAAQGSKVAVQVTPNGSIAGFVSWTFDQDGGLKPFNANAYDIGTAAVPIRSGYFGTRVTVNQSPGAPPAPYGANPLAYLVGPDNSVADVEVASFAGYARLNGRHSNGTAAAPTPSKYGNSIMAIAASGRGATSWGIGGQIYWTATEDWTDAARGMSVAFQTTTNGTTALTGRWEITHNGHLQVGAASTYDIGAFAFPVRAIYADTVQARMRRVNVSAATYLGNIPSNSMVCAVGGQLRANTVGQAPFSDGHVLTVLNFSGAPVTIIQEAGAGLYWVNPAGQLLVGTRTLAQGAHVSITTFDGVWTMSGTGIS